LRELRRTKKTAHVIGPEWRNASLHLDQVSITCRGAESAH
jgi:hypothetical protein